MHEDDVFCNPMAPVDEPSSKLSSSGSNFQKQNLSNEDFRKLIMTPSANVASTPAFGSKHVPTSVRGHRRQVIINEEFKKPQSTQSADQRKNKKKFYQQKKEQDEEENLLAELAKRYRDRAKERRENPEEQEMNTSNYNAVGNMSGEDAAERRKQLIEESKYLGGDMEHTHLVKGLDYALLQKVKAEIEFERDQRTIEMVESEFAKHRESDNEEQDSDNEEQDWSIKSVLAQNLMKILFETNYPEVNEFFRPRRLAYAFDLENDCPTDAFTSVIRSKAECPNWESESALSTSDIVLNKLIEIFEELREQGGRRRKKLKVPINEPEENKFDFINQQIKNDSNKDSIRSNRSSLINETKDLSSVYDQDLNFDFIKNTAMVKTKIENDLDIYDDIGEYVPSHHKLEDKKRVRDSLSPSSNGRHSRDNRRDSSSKYYDRRRRSSSREYDRDDRYDDRDSYRDRSSSYRSSKDSYYRDDRHSSRSSKDRYSSRR